LSTVTWDLFGKAAAQYGVPAAAALFVLWLSMTGRIRWQREVEQDERDAEVIRRDFEQRLAELTKDRDYWRDTSMDLLKRYSNEVETSESAVGTAVRALRRRS
jgi:hypothetical protein